MKKVFLSLLFCSLFAASVMAQKLEHFFYKEVPGWIVLGEKDFEKKLLICSMENGTRGKSLVDFGYTFVENYFYLVIHSENLNLIKIPEGQRSEVPLSLRMPDGKIETAPAGFVKLNNKTIMIPHVIPEAFFPYFLNAVSVMVEFPNEQGKTEIPLLGIQDAFNELGKCAESALKIREGKEQKL